MEEDYIPGEKRAPDGAGIVYATIAGIVFWIGLGVWLWV